MRTIERVLVVVGHPDDESFGMGATIASITSAGAHVSVLALSDGVGARGWKKEAAARRAEHFRLACVKLGATPLLNSVFPDQQSDTVPQLTINKTVEVAIDVGKPDEVYTHHVGDLNLDHRRVAEAVLVATRGLEIPVRCMTPEWPDRCVGPEWKPTISMAFTRDDLDRRLAACLCYADELRAYPHPRSERAVQERFSESFMEIR